MGSRGDRLYIRPALDAANARMTAGFDADELALVGRFLDHVAATSTPAREAGGRGATRATPPPRSRRRRRAG